MLELFSQRARQLIFLARFKAGQRGAAAIEIEDLLVAFIIEDQGEFENAVSSLFPNGKPVVQPGGQPHRPFLPPELASGLLPRVQALCAQSQPLPKESDMPLSEDGKAILRLADKLRVELQQSSLEPLHLLAAFLEDKSSRAAQLFRKAGITREKVIQFLREGE